MTRTLLRLATAVRSGSDIAVLHTIAEEGVGLALWHRCQSRDFQCWLHALPNGQLPTLSLTAPAGAVGPLLDRACAVAGMSHGPHRDSLVQELSEMARIFSEVLAAPFLKLRLEITLGQTCSRWRIEMGRGRLLCTLRGPGTEFGAARPDGTPDTIHRIPTGSVALLRGFMWPGRELMGIVHRAPAAPRNGAAGLLLVIDPAEDAGAC